MPTYEYKCKKCNNFFEEFQSITAEPLTDCPKCDGKIERVISGGAGFVFKGDGFYITENRSEKYKEAAKKESESSSPKTESLSKAKNSKVTPVKKEAPKETAKPKTDS